MKPIEWVALVVVGGVLIVALTRRGAPAADMPLVAMRSQSAPEVTVARRETTLPAPVMLPPDPAPESSAAPVALSPSVVYVPVPAAPAPTTPPSDPPATTQNDPQDDPQDDLTIDDADVPPAAAPFLSDREVLRIMLGGMTDSEQARFRAVWAVTPYEDRVQILDDFRAGL